MTAMPRWLAWSAGLVAGLAVLAAFLAWGRDGALLLIDMVAVICA